MLIHYFYQLFFPYGEDQGQDHLKGTFSGTECLCYICKGQKVRIAGRDKILWKGMLPFSRCRCNLGSEYRNYLSFLTKGS